MEISYRYLDFRHLFSFWFCYSWWIFVILDTFNFSWYFFGILDTFHFSWYFFLFVILVFFRNSYGIFYSWQIYGFLTFSFYILFNSIKRSIFLLIIMARYIFRLTNHLDSWHLFSLWFCYSWWIFGILDTFYFSWYFFLLFNFFWILNFFEIPRFLTFFFS